MVTIMREEERVATVTKLHGLVEAFNLLVKKSIKAGVKIDIKLYESYKWHTRMEVLISKPCFGVDSGTLTENCQTIRALTDEINALMETLIREKSSIYINLDKPKKGVFSFCHQKFPSIDIKVDLQY